MRLGHILERYQATKIIEYKFVEYVGITTVYSIMKCDNEHETIKFIVKSIHSKQAALLVWNDVLSGLQK